MKRHIVSRTERAILSGLKRWNKGVPEEVLAAEARQLLRARILKDNDRGRTQLDIAGRLNYSVSQVERLIKVARVEREDGEPSPLMLWRARERVMEPAPAPEAAFTPKVHSIGFEVKSEPEPTVAELKARIKALLEARDDEDDEDPRRKVTTSDDEDEERSEPVYAVAPYTHFKVRGRDEYIVVDDMRGLKPGVQVSFISGGLFGPQAYRRTVKSVQQVHQSQCLSLQVEPTKAS